MMVNAAPEYTKRLKTAGTLMHCCTFTYCSKRGNDTATPPSFPADEGTRAVECLCLTSIIFDDDDSVADCLAFAFPVSPLSDHYPSLFHALVIKLPPGTAHHVSSGGWQEQKGKWKILHFYTADSRVSTLAYVDSLACSTDQKQRLILESALCDVSSVFPPNAAFMRCWCLVRRCRAARVCALRPLLVWNSNASLKNLRQTAG